MSENTPLQVHGKKLPSAFVAQMADLLGPGLSDFLEALEAPPPVSVRFNPLKKAAPPSDLEPVPWCEWGCYLPRREVFTLDPLFHAGVYYVQEASSMLVGEAVRQVLPTGEPVRALDLCAAPGGKSTLLAARLPAGSLVLCNEVIRSRYQILRENLIKWGSPFTHTAQHDSSHFQGLQGFFDFILVDAPCSGEGLFRKDPEAIAEWSPEAVRHCAARQRRILADSIQLLRPGGILCYSTCTYNETENTANARWMAETFGLLEEKLKFPAVWQITNRDFGCQCYPHRVKGEGLYLSCFRKVDGEEHSAQNAKGRTDRGLVQLPKKWQPLLDEWLDPMQDLLLFQDEREQVFALPAGQLADLLLIRRQLPRTDLGLWVGTLKRNDFIPSPDLALSAVCHPKIPRIELSLEQSLFYLKKENISLAQTPAGWFLANYQGQPMGWMKGLQNRINNYYPKEWRIRMGIES